MLDDHEEGPGWLTPEEEAMLDEIAERIRPTTKAEREEAARRCAEATRYRLEREAAGDDQRELPAEDRSVLPVS